MKQEETEVICGLYPRVSTEDQSRFGHSLDEQEDRLRKLCEFKGYKIYKVYREEGVSAKNTNRPKFQEMIEDMKSGKINKIIVYKLDRLTRSIRDLETICTMLEEYNCSLESVAEEINTETANGKFFIRMLTILAQLKIERTSEWNGEFQQYLKIEPCKIVALEYSLSQMLSNKNISNKKERLLFLKNMVLCMDQLNRNLPIYDLSSNREFNKEKILELNL
ncbi:MAG: recombinase family protein [Bacilli bacterium]|nr:recombinase family protein [Bacilli bacterium]